MAHPAGHGNSAGSEPRTPRRLRRRAGATDSSPTLTTIALPLVKRARQAVVEELESSAADSSEAPAPSYEAHVRGNARLGDSTALNCANCAHPELAAHSSSMATLRIGFTLRINEVDGGAHPRPPHPRRTSAYTIGDHLLLTTGPRRLLR